MKKLLISLTVIFSLMLVIVFTSCSKKSVDISYNVEYYQEELNGDYKLYETVQLNGKSGKNTKAVAKNYDGFSLKDELKQNKLSTKEDNTVKIYYIRNEYNLNLSLDDEAHGVIKTNNGKYKYGYGVELNIKSNFTFNFLGWYNGNNLISDKMNYTFNMPSNDVSLEARFEKDTNVDNFTYEINNDDCILTGIKDKTLTDIVIPSYFTKINMGALSGCGQVKSLTLPFIGETNKENGTGIIYPLGYIFGKEAFDGATNTTQRYRNTVITEDSYSSSLGSTSYYIPNTLEEVNITCAKTVPSYFLCNTNVKTLTIPNTIKSTLSDALSDSSVETVYYDGNLSDYCKVDFGEYPLYGRANLYYRDDNNEYIAFDYKELIIPNDVEELGKWCFAYNENIETVVFGNNIKKSCDYVFYKCNNLNNVYFDGSINDWASIIFKENGNPISIVDTVNFYILDESGDVLYNGKKYKLVTDITISNIDKIEDNAFSYYKKLGIVTILDGVKEIGEDAFRRSSITEIYIPQSVTFIDEYAFFKCDNLKKIHNKSNVNINKEDYQLPDDCVID